MTNEPKKRLRFPAASALTVLCIINLNAACQSKHRSAKTPRLEKVISVRRGDNIQNNNNPPCHADDVDKTSQIAASMATNAVTKAFPNLEVLSPLINDVFTKIAVRAGQGITENSGGTIGNILYHDRHSSCGMVAVRLKRPLGSRVPAFSFSENNGATWSACVWHPSDDAALAAPSGSQHYVSCHYSAWVLSVDPRNNRYFVATYKNWSSNTDLAKVSLPN
jgi:hypothetical protein